jgi:lysine biosynthesis protein LysW
MPETYCPSCDAEIRVSRPRLGATVTCSECGESLEIISVDPFEVDFPLDEDDDDWDEGEEE